MSHQEQQQQPYPVTNVVVDQTVITQQKHNLFTVSYASPRLERKRQAALKEEITATTHNSSTKSSGVSSPTIKKQLKLPLTPSELDYYQLPSNVREDLSREVMETQLKEVADYRREKLEEANVEDWKRVSKEQSHERFFLRILIAEGVRRQAQLGEQSVFIKKILHAAEVAAKRGKKSMRVKVEDAANYDFVSQSLAHDVSQLLTVLGYAATLSSISALQIWQLE